MVADGDIMKCTFTNEGGIEAVDGPLERQLLGAVDVEVLGNDIGADIALTGDFTVNVPGSVIQVNEG